MNEVLVICGATGTGKSDVAFELAQRLNTEIISFDSVQVYKDFDVGTAKPNLAMRTQVPHHLVDEVNPTIEFTAGDFRKRALEVLKSLENKKNVILVGGTGFYLQALLKGMYDLPATPQKLKDEISQKIDRWGLEEAYGKLGEFDPSYAAKLHPHDRYRIARAFEIIELTGKIPTEVKRDFKGDEFPYPTRLFGLRRKKEVLRTAVEARTDFMLSAGLIEETKQIREKYGPKLKPLESVGYREVVSFLDGGLERDKLAQEISSATMALAKRQSTWFKRDKNISWFDVDELGVSGTVAKILEGL